MGQWLTVPLMAVGLALIIRALVRPQIGTTNAQPAPA
jgi:phosphatidylglycerol:prolipoprotein diacylglycerol transferase